MKVLLTGATGFLGNNLLRLLLEDGHDIVATIRTKSDPRPLQGLGVETILCDLSNPKEVVSVVADAEIVVHCAAMIHIGWTKLEQSRIVNVEATRELAQACRLRGIRMIHVSTVDTLAAGSLERATDENDTEPAKSKCSYVVSKREGEAVFMQQVESGLDGVIVNPGFMVGPWDWKPSSGEMMLTVASAFTPFAPKGGCSCVDVRDTACGIISAMQHARSGEKYILAGHNLTYLELWKQIAKTTNSKPPIANAPNWAATLVGRSADLINSVTRNESIVNSAATAMGSLYNWHSSEKAKEELGYKIGDLETALNDAWEWFKAYGYVKKTT